MKIVDEEVKFILPGKRVELKAQLKPRFQFDIKRSAPLIDLTLPHNKKKFPFLGLERGCFFPYPYGDGRISLYAFSFGNSSLKDFIGRGMTAESLYLKQLILSLSSLKIEAYSLGKADVLLLDSRGVLEDGIRQDYLIVALINKHGAFFIDDFLLDTPDYSLFSWMVSPDGILKFIGMNSEGYFSSDWYKLPLDTNSDKPSSELGVFLCPESDLS